MKSREDMGTLLDFRNCWVHRVENGAVQVNDATAAPGAPGASVGRKDDPATGALDEARKDARMGARFRETLRRVGAGDTAGAETGIAMAAALVGWFRAEPAPRSPAPPPPIAPAPPASPPRIDRVLIGEVGGDVEARIRIGSGTLAGAEIRLTSAPGSRAVAAQLLTRTDGSRQTLSVAMDELRLRLRNKGIALAASPARPRGADGRAGQKAAGGDGSKLGGGSGW